MNIGFEAKRVFQNFTGLGNYSRSLIQNLLKFYPETQAHLFAPKIVSHPRTQFFLDHPRVQTYAPQHPFRAWWRSYGMSAFVKNQKVDVFHGLSHELPFGLEKHGILKVVTIHDLIFLRYPHLYQNIDRKIYTAKLKHACQAADRIIAISAQTAQDLQELIRVPEKKISLIYQTCDDIFWEGKIRDVSAKYRLPSEYLIYVGSVIPRKNLLLIVQAMDLLPPTLRVPLIVIGSGKTYLQQVKRQIVQRGLEDLFIFLTETEFADFPSLYAGATFSLYPSEYEGFGIPILESLVSGTPAIVTKASSLPEAGGPGALYMDAMTAEDLMEKMRDLIEDRTKREHLVQAGLTHVEKFRPGRLTAELYGLYEEVKNSSAV